MSSNPCDRTFPLKLSVHYMEYARLYAFVHRHLLESLGREAVEELWRTAEPDSEDALLSDLLQNGWSVDEDAGDLVTEREALLKKMFSPPVQGVSVEDATRWLLSITPFKQLDGLHANLGIQREMTTYNALHLLVHHLATFAEKAMERFGKAAELMIYDGLREEIEDRLTPETSGQEWLGAIYARVEAAREAAERPEAAESAEAPIPAPLTMGAAGHVEEVIRVEEAELEIRMTQCSWADYYLDRHPTVGVLLGCCVDDPVYRRTADGLRLQRQFTLMEEGPYCDFRLYPAGGDIREMG